MAGESLASRAKVTMDAIANALMSTYGDYETFPRRDDLRDTLETLEPWLVEVFTAAGAREDIK